MADDINSAKKFEELSVELFNDFSTTTLLGGEIKSKTGIIITANSPFAETQRFVITNVYFMQNMLLYYMCTFII